eukprot:1569862-Pyramimonas_sp.AAC.1
MFLRLARDRRAREGHDHAAARGEGAPLQLRVVACQTHLSALCRGWPSEWRAIFAPRPWRLG